MYTKLIIIGIGLGVIPFIVHPIDNLIHFVMDNTTRSVSISLTTFVKLDFVQTVIKELLTSIYERSSWFWTLKHVYYMHCRRNLLPLKLSPCNNMCRTWILSPTFNILNNVLGCAQSEGVSLYHCIMLPHIYLTIKTLQQIPALFIPC